MQQGGYGAYNAYITAATRYAALGAPTMYDHPGTMYGSKFISGVHMQILGILLSTHFINILVK